MKLVAFEVKGAPHVGVLTDDGVVDITALGMPGTINGIIAGGKAMLERIEGTLKFEGFEKLPYESLKYANVVENTGKIVCVGLNYKSHAEETGGTVPSQPVFFSVFSDTLTPSKTPVELPEWQRCFDYEAELVIIIGKECYHITEDEAEECIFGYTVGNDLSARDCQFLESKQWLTGKSFPGFSPAGPVVVTADSFDPEQSHAIHGILNGEVVLSGDTNDMIFNCKACVAWASKYFALKPGDIIYTGTPAGTILEKPKGTRVWMKKGDNISIEIDGICRLDTPLV